jgi:hypothetical protein
MELFPVCTDAQFLEMLWAGSNGEACEGWQHCQFTTRGPLETANDKVDSIPEITCNFYDTVHNAAGILQCFGIEPALCPYEGVEFHLRQILI